MDTNTNITIQNNVEFSTTKYLQYLQNNLNSSNTVLHLNKIHTTTPDYVTVSFYLMLICLIFGGVGIVQALP